MYVSEPNTDGLLENLLEHSQDVSLWVAVEICSASSIKVTIKTFFKIDSHSFFLALVLRFAVLEVAAAQAMC